MDKVAVSEIEQYMGFDPTSTRLWTPEFFTEKDDKGKFKVPQKDWPLFKIRPLTSSEYSAMEDMTVKVSNGGETTIQENGGEKKLFVVSNGLKDVKNWKMKGYDVPMSIKDGIDVLIDRMPRMMFLELFSAIMLDSSLSKEEIEGLEF